MSDHGSNSSRIHHFIRSHPKEIQPHLISLDDTQLLDLMDRSQYEVSRALTIKTNDIDGELILKRTRVSTFPHTDEKNIGESNITDNQNIAQICSINNLVLESNKENISKIPSPQFWSGLREIPFTSTNIHDDSFTEFEPEYNSYKIESFVDWRGPNLLKRQDFQAEFVFKALSLQSSLAVAVLLKQGKRDHSFIQQENLYERFILKMANLGFPTSTKNSQAEHEGRRALAFSDDVLKCWSQPVSEDSSLDCLGSFSRSSKERRLASCSQTVLKALNKNNFTEAIPYMVLLGHFVLRPPSEIMTSIEDDMPSLIDYAKFEVFKSPIAKPRFYRYRDDLFWDCVILAICFPLDCGLIRLTKHLNISLPIISYTQQPDDVKKFWLRMILCLGALRQEIDIVTNKTALKLPANKKLDKISLKKSKSPDSNKKLKTQAINSDDINFYDPFENAIPE